MKSLIFTHSEVENYTTIYNHLNERNKKYQVHNWLKNGKYIIDDEIELVYVLGSGEAPTKSNRPNWVKEELILIEDLLSKGVKTIGICYGAQVLAHIHGFELRENYRTQLQWKQLVLAPEILNSEYTLDVLFWHKWHFKPTFNVNVKPIFNDDNSGFICDESCLAIQGHIELTPLQISALIDKNYIELASEFDTSQIDKIKSIEEESIRKGNVIFQRLVDKFL